MAKKLVFTGGHHNSALSVAKLLLNRGLGGAGETEDVEVVWLAHKYTMLGDRSLSAEYQEVTNAGIKFRELQAGKLYKTFNRARNFGKWIWWCGQGLRHCCWSRS